MLGLVPFAGLNVTGGAATQALTTSAGQMVAWAASGGSALPDSNTKCGDAAVKPDLSNSRILVQAPGIFLVTFNATLDMASGADVIAQLRKNGTVVATAKGKARCTTDKGQVSFQSIVEVTTADNPATIQTFANPSTSGFAGAGGAPKTEVPLDIVLSVAASTDTATIEEASFLVVRIG